MDWFQFYSRSLWFYWKPFKGSHMGECEDWMDECYHLEIGVYKGFIWLSYYLM